MGPIPKTTEESHTGSIPNSRAETEIQLIVFPSPGTLMESPTGSGAKHQQEPVLETKMYISHHIQTMHVMKLE